MAPGPLSPGSVFWATKQLILGTDEAVTLTCFYSELDEQILSTPEYRDPKKGQNEGSESPARAHVVPSRLRDL